MQKNIFKYMSVSVVMMLTISCNDNQRSPIPDYPVNLKLDLAGEYNTFRGTSCESHTFITPTVATDRLGFGGILVCTDFWGNYCAFDLSCPYEAKSNIRIRPDGPNAVCDSCGSQFDLCETGMGVVAKGPSKYPLKKYQTTISGNYLMIFR